MIAAVDSSILVAAVCESDRLHSECAALLDLGDLQIHIHALLETFSTLTGGQIVPRPCLVDFFALFDLPQLLPGALDNVGWVFFGYGEELEAIVGRKVDFRPTWGGGYKID